MARRADFRELFSFSLVLRIVTAERAGEGFQQVKKTRFFRCSVTKAQFNAREESGWLTTVEGKNEHFNVVFRLHFKTHKIIHKAHKILCIFAVEKNETTT